MPEERLDIFKEGQIKAGDTRTKGWLVREVFRNATLFQKSVSQVHAGPSDSTVIQDEVGTNDNFNSPLSVEEVERTVKSAQIYRKNNILSFTDLRNAERLYREHHGFIFFC